MTKISIIIPVYNVEEYLPECLDSIIAQTFSEIEIICVDDASPDNSGLILKKYAKEDSRFIIITHRTNQGLGPARNTGVAHASSPYIVFIDSDDYIAPNMLERLFDCITSNQADLSWCATAKVSQTGKILDYGRIPANIWTAEKVLDCENLFPSIQTVTNKLFKKELIEDIKQLPILIEDEPTIAQYLNRCKKIVTVDESLYFYRHTPESLSNPSSHSPKYWESFFTDYSLYFKILEKNKVNSNSIRKQLILRCSSLLWRIKTYDLLQSDSWDIQIQTILKHFRNNTIPIKKYCPPLSTYLKFTLKSKLSLNFKRELISIGILLTRNIWVNRCSYRFLPFDIIKVELSKIKNIITKVLNKVEFNFYVLIAKIYKVILKTPIWLVGERGNSAQENGLYFYKYLKVNKPHEKAYYIIDKSTEQFKNLAGLPSIINFNSFKHKLLFCAASYYVTSHNHYCFPIFSVGKRRYPKPRLLKNIFLDHGITYADVSQFYGKENSGIDLFICGAKPEEDYVRENFGYSKNEIAYTGFARFDGLHEFEFKKQILVMPTWRREIYDFNNKSEPQKEVLFKNSEYYKTFQSLISNKALLILLEKYNYRLIFYPHYEIQNFIHYFSSDHINVTIATKDKFDVQSLLKGSSLLITDTSSVHFDFAYMYKPSIYFRFDKQKFNSHHLPEGYFKFDSMGFGEVIETEISLINLIKRYLQDDCKINDKYLDRVKHFYPLHDRENCKRIYHSIIDCK